MLQLAQRTSAPRATRVSISTAVCTVMWSDPVTRAPLEPAVEGLAQIRIGGEATGEGDVRERAVEPGEQLTQRTQALQLARPEDAVAGRGARELDQARALYVAQHSRRPSRGRRGLVDREPFHRARAKLNTIVSRFGGGPGGGPFSGSRPP